MAKLSDLSKEELDRMPDQLVIMIVCKLRQDEIDALPEIVRARIKLARSRGMS